MPNGHPAAKHPTDHHNGDAKQFYLQHSIKPDALAARAQQSENTAEQLGATAANLEDQGNKQQAAAYRDASVQASIRSSAQSDSASEARAKVPFGTINKLKKAGY